MGPCWLLQPHRKVLKVAAQLPADGRDILVHCKTGIRSAVACHALASHGLSRLYTLDGGIIGWAPADAPLRNLSGIYSIFNPREKVTRLACGLLYCGRRAP